MEIRPVRKGSPTARRWRIENRAPKMQGELQVRSSSVLIPVKSEREQNLRYEPVNGLNAIRTWDRQRYII